MEKRFLLLLALPLAGAITLARPSQRPAPFDPASPWPTVTAQTRPWARWWWMGSAVDAPTLRRQLAEFKQIGLGGVEITPIYGAKGYEAQYLDFLSPGWLHALGTTTHTADSLGLGVDMNLGTGWPYGGPQIKPEQAAAQALAGPWQLKFTAGGPELPKAHQLKQLTSWPKLPDANAARFSGRAEYTTTFTLPAKPAADYLLRLGDVRESARVWVNGREVGLLWSVPYQRYIGEYLRKGRNELKIEVANLMANRIIDLDQRKITWRNYHEINFANLAYQPFDAAK